MESILVKIFATALALSQVMTAPDAVKTRFERTQDQPLVAQLLRAACAHMRKAFDIEDINLEDLLATAMDDPQAAASESKAFLAAEDRRFYQHKGIDERGLIRAFISNLAASGRPQGGSTITQQIVKTLLVGEDLTYERKIREMIVASRLEHTLSKAEILELYLNSVYLGRGSWGIELAARGYFGKPAKELTLEQGALPAGLTKGPNYFNPDRHPTRAQERLAYVLSRLQEDGGLAADQSGRGLPALPKLVAYERPRRDIGFHFVDQVAREAKSLAGIDAITSHSYTVRSTINPQLQRAVEAALQEGLSRYERGAGRVQFRTAEASLGQSIQRETDKKIADRRPAWQRALANARLPLYDVHWAAAIVLEKP